MFFLLSSCASKKNQEDKFEQDISDRRCEQAYQNIPIESTSKKITNQSKEVLGTLSSYALTGGSYAVEVIWDITGGTAMVLAICSPQILASMVANSAPMPCFADTDKDLWKVLAAPPLGRKTFEETKNWRCPDLTNFTRSLQKVSSCYQKRGKEGDLEKAKNHLKAIINSKNYFSCLSPDLRKEIDQNIQEIGPL